MCTPNAPAVDAHQTHLHFFKKKTLPPGQCFIMPALGLQKPCPHAPTFFKRVVNNNPHLARWAKKELPDALKEHQFTSENNPNPEGNDKDGDGETNEKKPFESKKAALVRLAAALPVGSDERKTILRMAAKKQASQRTHHSKGIEQLSDNDLRKLFNDLLKFDKMMAKWNRSGPAWGGPHPDDWAAFHAEAKMRGIKL